VFVELRVHGVSGTPPVDMLDHPLVKQVAGDTDGRFFRPVDSAGNEVRGPDGHILEGYHWGPQTSGSWKQALWLALVPFGLVNAAYFMLPDGGGTVARALARAALRVLSIVLTGLVVLSIAQAAVDLFAWQWTGVGGRSGDPRWWLVAGFAVVVAGLLVIRFVVGPLRRPAGVRADDGATGLAGGEFFTGDLDMPALRNLHLTAGLTILSVLAAALVREHGGADWLYWVAVGLLGWTVVHTMLLGDPAKRRALRKFFAEGLPVVVLVAGILLLAGCVVAMGLVGDYPAANRRTLPGIADLGRWTAGLAMLSLAVLVAATLVLAVQTRERGTPPPFRRFLGGMTGPVVAALGTFLGVGFTSALAYGVLRLLRPADAPDSMTLPLFYLRIAFAAGVAVVLLVLLVLVVVAWMMVSAKRFAAMVRASATPEQLPDDQVRGVARAWFLARLKFATHWFAITLAAAGTVLTVAGVAEAWGETSTSVCVSSGTWLSDCRDLPGLDLVTIGTVALVALGGFLVYLGRRAVGESAIRRGACVVWDVVSFWPAAVHPLVPPPYSPKVIEDLRRRIEWHVSKPDTFLVLAGHSQGSMIAAAALTRLAPEHRAKVALLTYGSQLQLAYARAFPAYVNYDFLCHLKKEVLSDRWVSLYRETDPFGGPVLTWDRSYAPAFTSKRLGTDAESADELDEATGVRRLGSEWRLLDPCPSNGVDTPREAMRKHTAFSVEPVWAQALAKLTEGHERPPDDSGDPAAAHSSPEV
jgi:Na+-transporting methylmalonyl-CoA/oxaloacetate decarboxylase gamma subunit